MTENENLTVVETFLTSLWQGGVTQICLSPGSRSTPLAAIVSRDDRFRVWSLLDERSAGFFAVGLAKATQRPVVLICTSGTAAGNYFPSVMEARFSAVPLVIVTADRPPELRDIGSNQTVFQTELYGSHVKWFYEMPVPDAFDLEGLHRHARYIGARAVKEAITAPKGPVHINYPFREPLMPPARADNRSEHPVVQVYPANLSPDAASLAMIRKKLSEAKRPLIVCGPQDDMKTAAALADFCGQSGIPILADPLSQLRSRCGLRSGTVMDTHDLMLRSSEWRKTMRPDFIVRLGRTVSSKATLQALTEWNDVFQVVVYAEDTMTDSTLSGSAFVQSDSLLLINSLTDGVPRPADLGWLCSWQDANQFIRSRLTTLANLDNGLNVEGRVFQELADLLPDGALFIGNSMPIRYADLFWPTTSQELRTYGNRGASGIDGIISSAFGVAAGHGGPTTLVIGDISFYHDLPGLLAAARLNLSLQIVLVNNDGGGIFKHLSQANYPDVIDAFTTPHGMEYEQVVSMFKGTWTLASTWNDFCEAIRGGIGRPGLSVVEARFDKDASVHAHQRIVRELLDDFAGWQSGRERSDGTNPSH